MIQPVNVATPVSKVAPAKNVTKPAELVVGNRNPKKYASIDEKQNDNLLMELNYIGNQLKAMLDVKAGKEVKVDKVANKLPEDEQKTTAQKQKDDMIVELGYIGDVLKKMSDVSQGKEVETVKEPKIRR